MADRTAEAGYPITRGTIAKIESNSRLGKLDIAEVAILGAALGVPPIQLLYPALPDGPAEVVPGHTITAINAVRWFAGEGEMHPLPIPDHPGPIRAGARFNPATYNEQWDPHDSRLGASRRLRLLLETVIAFKYGAVSTDDPQQEEFLIDRAVKAIKESENLAERMRRNGMTVRQPYPRESSDSAESAQDG
ncbi:hypothetical protein [Prescottella equi]|uniref:hypothetical protein n=1 Tax=Rhodococcus hoagii TaxID=43767 RepID=UPI0007CD5B99|nr:hypothetical protein [Prescottella equi]